jgi:hypothetical protein
MILFAYQITSVFIETVMNTATVMAYGESCSKDLDESKPPEPAPTKDVETIAKSKESDVSAGVERKSKRKIVTLPISGKV